MDVDAQLQLQLRQRIEQYIALEVETVDQHEGCHSVCGGWNKGQASLSRHARAECARGVANAYQDSGLDFKWNDPERRATFVGEFSL